jgi:plasmid rolling circle replication initiator protein Rep
LFIFIRCGDIRLGLNPKVQREIVEVKNEIGKSVYSDANAQLQDL